MSNNSFMKLFNLSDEDFNKTNLSKIRIKNNKFIEVFDVLSQRLKITKFQSFLLFFSFPILLLCYAIGLLQIRYNYFFILNSNFFFVFIPLLQCFVELRGDYNNNAHWTTYWIFVCMILLFEETIGFIRKYII